MQRFLVVSDSHGNRDCLVELAGRYRGEVDGMFHCGDSQLEPDDSLWSDFLVVTGNCDFDPRFKKEQLVKLGDETIFMTHGHLFNVNSSIANLLYRSQELNASMAFYGHTHALGAELINNVLVVNPGSICFPRGRYRIKTYAMVTVDEKSYQVEFYNENHECQRELSCSFSKG